MSPDSMRFLLFFCFLMALLGTASPPAVAEESPSPAEALLQDAELAGKWRSISGGWQHNFNNN